MYIIKSLHIIQILKIVIKYDQEIPQYKISEYADDTQLFLNGSENSLREPLDILKMFIQCRG